MTATNTYILFITYIHYFSGQLNNINICTPIYWIYPMSIFSEPNLQMTVVAVL